MLHIICKILHPLWHENEENMLKDVYYDGHLV